MAKSSAAQTSLVVKVIVGTMLGWLLLQLIGAQMNWPPKYALLADLAAMAGFLWALITLVSLWRANRRNDRA